MGLSSAQLGRSWGAFGLSWVPLRCLLASFWVLLGCSWSHLGSHRRLRARFWMVLGASWLGFGELWGSFRYHFRRRCANCCRDPSMAFTLAFRYLLAARRYVRSTSAASRRESRACQTVMLSSSLCLPLKPMSKASLRSSQVGLPPSFYSFPRTRTDRRTSPAICF